jgi:polysaccharide chain length determinant protein (PEP-CTERM system associated)
MAQRVVQTLLDSLREGTLGINRSDSDRAQLFLQHQIDEYEKRLVTAEDRLAEFKKRNVGMMPDERGDYFTRLQAALNTQERLESDLAAATNRRNELARQLEGEEPVFGLAGGAGGGVTASEAAIEELRGELARMRLRFTDQHPEVRAILDTMAQLEARAAQERGALRANPELLGLQQNPVYQNLQIAYNEAQIQVRTLSGQLAEQKARTEELRRLLDTIPEVEAELVRLTRDYEVTKGQYETFLRRLESARISEEAEESSDEITFRVMDPAAAPLLPTGPPRTLLFGAVLAMAFAFGGGIALVMHQMHPVFGNSKALGSYLELPVLGTVGVWTSVATTRAKQLQYVSVSLAMIALLTVFVSVVMGQEVAVELISRIRDGAIS